MKIFWSWQSDIDGKISRHFVRECLENAAKILNEDSAITERFEVDHDTKGVPGSPPITETIFDKIKGSDVFVADVTPVASLVIKDSSGKERIKKIMNPNVAIETGYAIAKLDNKKIITIINDEYGDIEDLPFDLKYKRGPIKYSLTVGASKQEVVNEAERLTNILVDALKYFCANIKAEPSNEEIDLDLHGPGLFIDTKEPIVKIADGWSSIKDKSYFLDVPAIYSYVRIIPIPKDSISIKKTDLKAFLFDREFRIFPLFSRPDQTPETNQFGAIVVKMRENKIPAFVQILKNGTIIGFSAIGPTLPLVTLKNGLETFISSSLSIIKLFSETFGVKSIKIEIGLICNEDSFLSLPRPADPTKMYMDHLRGPLESKKFLVSGIFPLTSESVEEIIRDFIQELTDDIGMPFDFGKHNWK
jgi:hypothetical protein